MKTFEKILLAIISIGLLFLVMLAARIFSGVFIVSVILALGFYFFLGFFYFNNIPIKDIRRLRDHKLSIGRISFSLLLIIAMELGLVGVLFFAIRGFAFMGFWVIGIYAAGIMFVVNLVLILLNKDGVYKKSLMSISWVLGMLVFCGIFYYYLMSYFY